MKDLKLNHYLFSISWPRILPSGIKNDYINEKGIEHYDNLINMLLENRMTPIVTLYLRFWRRNMEVGKMPVWSTSSTFLPTCALRDLAIESNTGSPSTILGLLQWRAVRLENMLLVWRWGVSVPIMLPTTSLRHSMDTPLYTWQEMVYQRRWCARSCVMTGDCSTWGITSMKCSKDVFRKE